MTIKIDDDLRIRISQDEFSTLLLKQSFEKHYQVVPYFDFSIRIEIVNDLNQVDFDQTKKIIFLKIRQEDFLKLKQMPFQKKGLQINNVNLQCDLFDSVKK